MVNMTAMCQLPAVLQLIGPSRRPGVGVGDGQGAPPGQGYPVNAQWQQFLRTISHIRKLLVRCSPVDYARGVKPDATSSRRLLDPTEERADPALRPRRFDEFVGQKQIVDNLKVYVRAATARNDPLDHVLLSGPPGLGKTSFAYILAEEMGV